MPLTKFTSYALLTLSHGIFGHAAVRTTSGTASLIATIRAHCYMTLSNSPFEVTPDQSDGYLKPDFFRSLQLRPATVIDVGVSRGTPWLYNSFPKARFVLVDPLPGFEKTLINPLKSYESVNIGLGSARGILELDLRGPRSSVHKWSEMSNSTSEGRAEVPIEKLDTLIDDKVPTGSIGLKIDTEGHEVEVLRGLDRHADRVDFIVCECSIRRRFADDYRFSELISEMAAKGFEMYNFLSLQKPRPVHYDCLFLRRDDHRFGLGGIRQTAE